MTANPLPLRYSIGIGLSLLAALLIASGLTLSLRAQVEGDDIIPENGSGTVLTEGELPAEPTSNNSVRLFLRPHCEEIDVSNCTSFEAEDPQTLVTPTLHPEENLDLDVVVNNADQLNIERVRVWLGYDPTVLEGTLVSVGDALPITAPGEEDFDAENGYVMVDAESEDIDGTTETYIVVARVQFQVKTVPGGGRSILAFYDPDGIPPHTAIYSSSEPETSILEQPLGSLAVLVEETAQDPGTPEETPPSEESSSAFASSVSSSEASVSSSTSSQYSSVYAPLTQVSSATASSNSSVSSLEEDGSDHPAATRTSFVLTQVQNVRVTTDDSSLYIGWDALPSPELKGYHVYYGTQMGKYIQRRTVRPEQTTLAVYSLVRGTTYYAAVRGFNAINEETAFSQEVAVKIGDPSSATSPLGNVGFMNGNPLGGSVTGVSYTNVPGASGPAETAALIVAVAAVMGTLFAFRRQTLLPHSRP